MTAVPPSPTVVPVSSGRSSGCLVAVCVLLVIALAVSVFVNLALIAARAPGAGIQKPDPLAQKWVSGDGDAKVLLIELSGVIMEETKGGGMLGVPLRPVRKIERELDEAAKDDSIRAVVFAVDSPGGSVYASDEIWHLVKRFKERTKEKKKPVVVHMGSLCASGGYYVSAPADAIIAGPTTITGSIGVIMESFNLAGLVEKVGVKAVTIKAGANKDMLNPFEPVKPDHVEILQRMIDDAYDLFVKRVADGRGSVGGAAAPAWKLGVDDVRALADGRIYTAEDALKNHLVDAIGYREDAVAKAKELAGLKPEDRVTVFRYAPQPSLATILAGDVDARSRLPAFSLDLSPESLVELGTPRLLYLFRPGVK